LPKKKVLNNLFSTSASYNNHGRRADCITYIAREVSGPKAKSTGIILANTLGFSDRWATQVNAITKADFKFAFQVFCACECGDFISAGKIAIGTVAGYFLHPDAILNIPFCIRKSDIELNR
jgi:hypothetical protein